MFLCIDEYKILVNIWSTKSQCVALYIKESKDVIENCCM